jgi:putative DNA primase/helicase
VTTWINYFVHSLAATGKEGHLDADRLRARIQSHNGGEAYHCAFDLVKEELIDGSHVGYKGLHRPAMGYVWFDFDSHDGGVQAYEDTKKFVSWLGISDAFICYSGSKGFHVGVPFGYFGIEPSTDLGSRLNQLAKELKKTYLSIDTTVFNPGRKFRALGSRHPKTGLCKIQIGLYENTTLEDIKRAANPNLLHGLFIPIPELRSPLPKLAALFHVEQPGASEKSQQNKSNKNAGKEWEAPTGEAAFAQCGFLSHAKANSKTITEPEWYAALSVVSRFQEGRKQCHAISDSHPGYSVNECNKKIDQALELPPRTCENINTLWNGCKECPLWGKINSPVNLFERKFWDITAKGFLKPKYDDLLKAFNAKQPYQTIADMKTVVAYNGTHYEDFTPIEMKAFAENVMHPKPQDRVRQEFIHKVMSNNVKKRSFFFDTVEDKLNFKNGVFCTESGKLLAHSPEFGFRHVLPYDYVPDAKCPEWERWILHIMCDDPSLAAILQEFMGYVIRGGEYKYHRALWLSGTGRNGKSTFIDTLKALIGSDNYSTCSIKQIVKDRFAAAELDGKIANFSEETSPEELSDSGPFKNLTGNGELTGQKKYGALYTFRSRAKLIMSYNTMPNLQDLSVGMLTRPIAIPWKRDYSDEAKQDKGLQKRLLKELSGIFNWAWAGWLRLEEQQAFTYSASSAAEMRAVREESDTVYQWFLAHIEVTGNEADKVSSTQLYKHYRAVRQDDGDGYSYSERKFYQRLKGIKELANKYQRSNGASCYEGIKLLDSNNKSKTVSSSGIPY